MRLMTTFLVTLLLACGGNGGSTCPVGSEGCECTTGGACNTGLDCVSGVCVDAVADTSTDPGVDTGMDTGTDTGVDTTDDTPAETECTIDSDCEDADPCTTDTCDSDFGECVHDTLDADGDGYPARYAGSTDCGGTDCDDTRDDTHPDATPVCGTEDHDCSGEPDNDEDGDGYVSAALCAGTGDDCDDFNDAAHPGGTSDCQTFDADCDGYAENDQDGDGAVAMSCGGNDCNDGDPQTYYGATEVCDDVDQDCDGNLLDAPGADDDGDGYLDNDCGGADCDDSANGVHPGAPDDLCDTVDNDCDGVLGVADDDGDGYVDEACTALSGDDCDDDDLAYHPGAIELCDMLDQDCDGAWDEGGADDDLDGYLDAICGGDDCDDTRSAAHPGASEICRNGRDDDCDGLVDALVKVGSDIRITSAPGYSENPDITWNGDGYGLSWDDDRDGNKEIYFTLVDEGGTELGADIRVTNQSAESVRSSVSSAGGEYGIVWEDSRDGSINAYFAVMSGGGAKLVGDARVSADTHGSTLPEVAWSWTAPGTYGVAWYSGRAGNGDVFFARLNQDTGANVTGDMAVTTDAADSDYPSIMYTTASTFGIAWQDNRHGAPEIYFAQVGLGGTITGGEHRISNNSGLSIHPSLAWGYSTFGIAWRDTTDGDSEIYMALLDSAGSKITSDVVVTSDASDDMWPSATWGGDVFGVAWNKDSEIYFAAIDFSGARVGSVVRVTTAAGVSEDASLTWNGDFFAVTWNDNRDGNYEIYMGFLDYCD